MGREGMWGCGLLFTGPNTFMLAHRHGSFLLPLALSPLTNIHIRALRLPVDLSVPEPPHERFGFKKPGQALPSAS